MEIVGLILNLFGIIASFLKLFYWKLSVGKLLQFIFYQSCVSGNVIKSINWMLIFTVTTILLFAFDLKA